MNNALSAVLVIPTPGPTAGGPMLDVTSTLVPAAVALGLIVALSVVIFLLTAARRPRRRLPRPTYAWTPRSVVRGTAALVLVLLASGAAHAQGVADGLQCHRVTDAERKRLKAVVDLDAPAAGLAPGCRLSRAKLYCTPTRARIQPGTLFDGNTPLAELPYHGRPAETDRICYEVTCPTAPAVTETVTDRFGTRAIKRSTTEMLCTPATGGTLPPPASGFQLTTPTFDIQPGINGNYCYYFRTPNDVAVPVRKIVSELGPGVRSVVMFTTSANGMPVDRLPPGTISSASCDMFVLADTLRPRWIYAGDPESTEMTMPADDGADHPLALEIPPTSSGFLMMHHHNPTTQPITTRVKINLEALESPVYTKTDTFTAYTGDIVIPPKTYGHDETRSCPLPSGATFWRWSMRTHQHAFDTAVLDGQTLLYANGDWTNPGASLWPTPPFQTFAAPHVQYYCNYTNPSTRTIRTGSSPEADEQCMAVGYFFPADRPRTCYSGYMLD